MPTDQQQPEPEQHRRTAARCDLTLKFDRLPDDARTTDGRTSFTLDVGGHTARVSLKSKAWRKVEDAAKAWPSWTAAISGKLGAIEPGAFTVEEAGVQVFERKPKAPPAAPPSGASPTPPAPPPRQPPPAAAPPPPIVRHTLASAHRAHAPVVEQRRRPSREVAAEFRDAQRGRGW